MANAWTNIGGEVQYSTGEWHGAAVCAVELPSLLPLLCVQPRRFPPVAQIRESPAGDPSFDDVQLTPDERDRLARSDSPLAALADVRTPQEAMAGSRPWIRSARCRSWRCS